MAVIFSKNSFNAHVMMYVVWDHNILFAVPKTISTGYKIWQVNVTKFNYLYIRDRCQVGLIFEAESELIAKAKSTIGINQSPMQCKHMEVCSLFNFIPLIDNSVLAVLAKLQFK